MPRPLPKVSDEVLYKLSQQPMFYHYYSNSPEVVQRVVDATPDDIFATTCRNEPESQYCTKEALERRFSKKYWQNNFSSDDEDIQKFNEEDHRIPIVWPKHAPGDNTPLIDDYMSEMDSTAYQDAYLTDQGETFVLMDNLGPVIQKLIDLTNIEFNLFTDKFYLDRTDDVTGDDLYIYKLTYVTPNGQEVDYLFDYATLIGILKIIELVDESVSFD